MENQTVENQTNDRFEVQSHLNPQEVHSDPQQVMSKVVISAILAGIIGAVAWGLISFYSEREIGYVAWGIGALVGFAVANFAKSALTQNHLVVSVICALGGVIGGKYLDYYLIVRDLEKELGASLDGLVSFRDMFGGYDILWIALAVITAWTLPQRMSGRQ